MVFPPPGTLVLYSLTLTFWPFQTQSSFMELPVLSTICPDSDGSASSGIILSNSRCHSEFLVQTGKTQLGIWSRARHWTRKNTHWKDSVLLKESRGYLADRSSWVLASKSTTENVAKFIALHHFPQGKEALGRFNLRPTIYWPCAHTQGMILPDTSFSSFMKWAKPPP